MPENSGTILSLVDLSRKNAVFLEHATFARGRRFVVSLPSTSFNLHALFYESQTKLELSGDSGDMPDNRCSNCLHMAMSALGPAKGYVESLEARLEKMDKLLSKLLPGIDISQEVERLESKGPSEPETLARNDDECAPPLLAIQLNKLSLNPPQNRFFGKSSGYQLIQTALDMKEVYTGEQRRKKVAGKSMFPFKRIEFWESPPWMASHPEREEEIPPPNFTFPEDDLIHSLIDLYFTHLNVFLPLLHRPTFEKEVAEDLHHSDPMFGAVLLLVCAHGSRFSDDPRVLAEGSDSLRSAGWKWFEQVTIMRKSLIKRTTLYELQMFSLHVMFAQTSETPHGVWAEIGLALRLAQDVGAHRRRRKGDVLRTAEDELWKRAFWTIISLDRTISSFSGRPCGLQDEDFDLDLPLECDDEYWDRGFEQPSDKPSSISFFNTYLRLMDIHAYAMRSIYSIKRSGSIFNQSAHRSDQELITELDSAMNNWMDSVPSHLRWPPNGSDELALTQSAALHATYYHLQIFIHRPFIPSPRNPIPGAFPSLAICTNAARSCCHVLESFTRVSPLPLSQLQNNVFISAVILLLNIWSGKRSGCAPNLLREMEDVRRCVDVLKVAETRWASAGRYCDILTELAYAGDLSIPPTHQLRSNSHKKRNRDADEEYSPGSSHSVSPTVLEAPRSMAGSKRVSLSNTSPHSKQMPSQAPPLFALPMYGNELGRLPIYGQFSFSEPYVPQMPAQQPTTFDPTLISNLTSGPAGLPPSMDGYAFGNMFNAGQAVDNSLSQAQYDSLVTGDSDSDFASFLSGATFNGASGNGWSAFGSVPAMDNDTMTMWSTAPRTLSELISFVNTSSYWSLTFIFLSQVGRLEPLYFER
ncbi:fungal-specific transcription factor domain-containing protein [Gymnopilus junonius]|uniref:Fungal-specific transcription factor domain-containing protein n=1 Tax=Gymnopilus junonius TaxID=109634 RepID=A0A9P5NJZ3_GYMJU|nr:fungal-specific transcription factor domain-containing protein [Gymnopilus junonius]